MKNFPGKKRNFPRENSERRKTQKSEKGKKQFDFPKSRENARSREYKRTNPKPESRREDRYGKKKKKKKKGKELNFTPMRRKVKTRKGTKAKGAKNKGSEREREKGKKGKRCLAEEHQEKRASKKERIKRKKTPNFLFVFLSSKIFNFFLLNWINVEFFSC